MGRVYKRLPLTLPHFVDFGDERVHVGSKLVNPQSWDAVRSAIEEFRLPTRRDEWEQQAARPEFAERAAVIVGLMTRLGARSLASYGVGGAVVERHVALLAPHVRLICSDFAPSATGRLARIFTEAQVRLLDLRHEGPLEADLHLMHRIDTELSNGEWRWVFERFSAERILFVAGELIGDWATLRRKLGEARARRNYTTRAGWIRTEAALRGLWRTHADSRLQVGGLRGFLLLPTGKEAAGPEHELNGDREGRGAMAPISTGRD